MKIQLKIFKIMQTIRFKNFDFYPNKILDIGLDKETLFRGLHARRFRCLWMIWL